MCLTQDSDTKKNSNSDTKKNLRLLIHVVHWIYISDLIYFCYFCRQDPSSLSLVPLRSLLSLTPIITSLPSIFQFFQAFHICMNIVKIKIQAFDFFPLMILYFQQELSCIYLQWRFSICDSKSYSYSEKNFRNHMGWCLKL